MHSEHSPPAIHWRRPENPETLGHLQTPALIFWTSHWCPPCHEIRQSLLGTAGFAEAIEGLTAIWLDGDDAGAQLAAETLGVSGYPALLLRRDGKDLLRAPGGHPAQDVCRLVAEARTASRPLDELARCALGSPAGLEELDWRRLAFHWWTSDRRDLQVQSRAEAFLQLRRHCPAGLENERLRFFVQALYEGAAIDDPASLSGHFLRALGSGHASYSNLYPVLVAPVPILEQLYPTPAERRGAASVWLGVLERMRREEPLTATETLITHSCGLQLLQALLPRDDDEWRTRVSEAVSAAVSAESSVQDRSQRQTVVNMAVHLAGLAGASDLAGEMLLRAVETTAAPEYFLALLGEHRSSQGSPDEAFDYMRQAVEQSAGSASRFAMRVRFLGLLLHHRPDDVVPVATLLDETLNALAGLPGMFCGRNRQTAERLVELLRSWAHGGPLISGIAEQFSWLAEKAVEPQSAERALDYGVRLHSRA